MSSYPDKLKHPNWQKKRLEILSRDKFTCRNCEASDRPLHVHHSYYVKGRDPWEYPLFSLVTLCEQCHSAVGEEKEQRDCKLEDWEIALDWILGGTTESDPWYMSAEIDSYCKSRKVSRVDCYKSIEQFILSK